jgi:hypothetical protein
MILCNSRGWAPVGRVDDLMIAQDEAFTRVITAAIDSCPWMRSSRPVGGTGAGATERAARLAEQADGPPTGRLLGSGRGPVQPARHGLVPRVHGPAGRPDLD